MKKSLEANPLYFKSTRDKITRFSDSIKLCSTKLRDPADRGIATKIYENISQILYINNLASHCRSDKITDEILKTLLIDSERFIQNLSESNIFVSQEIANMIKDTVQQSLTTNFGNELLEAIKVTDK